MLTAVLDAVLVGSIEPLSPDDPRPSGIDKQPLDRAVAIHALGIDGDHQADTTVHGGPDKAIHHYPHDHYAWWGEELPHARARLQRPGAFGENFSTSGWTEHDICQGDVIAVGTAILQVSHGRQPCSKLNSRFETPDMVRRVTQSTRCGWYYRVLQTGIARRGDDLRIVERPLPDWTVARLFRVLFEPPVDAAQVEAALHLDSLAEAWKTRARKRLNRAS